MEVHVLISHPLRAIHLTFGFTMRHVHYVCELSALGFQVNLTRLSQCLRLPHSSDLARLIILCRSESQIASELARFIVDLIASRKRAFAKLTVRDLFPESS